MTNICIYNIFLFLSTLTRNIIHVFSIILLYNKGYNINNILIFLFFMYLFGIFINYISLRFNYKIILVLSFLLYGIGYLYLSFMGNNIFNLIVLAFIFSFSNYSYHSIRHLLAMSMVSYNNGRYINIFLIVIYSAVIIANIMGILFINNLSFFIISVIIIGLSFLSFFPIFLLYKKESNDNYVGVFFSKRKVIYSVLEQFKVIFMELQPLYIYLYVKRSISYVGVINIIINFSSLLVMLFLSKKISIKYYKYICILLGIVLVLKLNIFNSYFFFLIIFFEGIGIKLYERGSLNNLYDFDNSNLKLYLIIEEFIFFISKCVFMFLFIIFSFNLKTILYISIFGLVVSSFYLEER